ncbi:PadR family transcriptional regulator [Paenibacillus sp. SYP-B3998]|uniref:PadR family transcriptional regulator n=1 Tax=Paenibacillus sp. SYP-B3998 TaxID=2678564 RepID=A0A6G4A5X0_9BACL|nr:PadR family transcriptional regulator [Paenibacillus sp. SYP-B3998]NEW09906.1 PadR family transcriptional regulator [Paenibacillus sp. SYP-B3998]
MKLADETYINKLLNGWEQVYKNSQLTFWVMLALKEGPKHMAEIKAFIDKSTNGTMSVDDKSMYRALRRYYDSELTDFSNAPGKGPDKKIYRLSPIGETVFALFVQRNMISTLYKPEIKALIERSVPQ